VHQPEVHEAGDAEFALCERRGATNRWERSMDGGSDNEGYELEGSVPRLVGCPEVGEAVSG
jgi:hypothetical protein